MARVIVHSHDFVLSIHPIGPGPLTV